VRLFLLTVFSLVGVVVLAAAIGYAPTRNHWGEPGVSSMVAIGLICCIAAIVGALPMSIVARRWPLYIGQAALAGTTLRLLLTAMLGLGYQTIAKPHLSSYLVWATIFYLLVLTVETGFALLVVRRHYTPTGQAPGSSMKESRAKEAAV